MINCLSSQHYIGLVHCNIGWYYNSLEEENDAVKERDDLRHERHKERERDRRIARAAPERRAKLERSRDRDVTEQIALGKPAGAPSHEALFDQRLFNQTKVCVYLL